MTGRHWLVWCLQLGWVGLLGWIGAIAFASSTFAQSRIVPDNTLGAESSIVTPNVQNLPRVEITGGAVRDANLFHSFREFNVDNGRGAYFQNPNASIKNIFTRVTGNNRSEIFGTLGTIGNAANLFLINPNGIIFGPNAVLNVGASFVGTTANAIEFGNFGIFSASTPVAPGPILTINPSALLFNQVSPASITNMSTAPAGLNPVGVEVTGLRVPDGQSLLLVGGNVNVEGGSLRAYQGHIELAGLAAPGTVGLNLADNTLSLNVPEGVARADVSLTNGGEVNVRGANGGSIAINAQNVNLAGESKLRAGIESGLGTPDSLAGDIEINATGSTTLSDGSFITNAVQRQAVGKGGNININTGSLTLRNNPILGTNTFLDASTVGQGDSGRVFVQASGAVSLANSRIFSSSEANAVGNTGGIFITAESLSLTNGAALNANTDGLGDAGAVFVQASGAVSLANSNILNDVDAGAVGNSGGININAASLSLTDGAALTASTNGLGDAGKVFVQASGAVSVANSTIFNNVETRAVGNSGGIFITAESLSLTDNAQLQSSILRAKAPYIGGRGNPGGVNINAGAGVTLAGSIIYTDVGSGTVGNGGDINIKARSFSLTDGAVLQAINAGQGNGGNITIDARDTVKFDGTGVNSISQSAVQSSIQPGGVGKGGDVRVTTGSLSLTNGFLLFASNAGQGNAGNITIDARDTITFDGTGSSASTEVGNNSVGSGGDIRVNTRALFLKNGGQLTASNFGQGNAGSIIINASDTIAFDGVGSDGFGSGAYSTVESTGVGDAGNINVTTRLLSLNNAAQINASTYGFGDGGNITINANTFEALNGGQVATSTTGTGKAGTINLNLKESLTLAGSDRNFTQRPSGIFAKTDSGSTGQGGSIFIDPRQATIRDGAKISVNSDGTGNAGNITLQAGTLTLDKGASISAQTFSSQGGNINLQLGDILLLRRGSQISTNAGTAQAGGDGGNINLNSKFIVAIPDESSDITANAFSGTGGRVQINTQGLFGIQSRPQPTDKSDITASSTLGVAGVVNINTPDQNTLQNNLTQLPKNIIDANALIANSCIARRHNQSGGTFFIIGNGGLQERPGDAPRSLYSTGTIRSVPDQGEKAISPTSTRSVRPWKNGDPIVEAQGIYRLANGNLVLSRECP